MILTTMTVAALFGLAETSTDSALFDSLDANSDGLVEAAEIGESQQVWFTRALRVADDNGDGRLTSEELETALSDPEPRPASSQRTGPRRQIDLKRLDRNGDGMITLDEIPERGKERFQRMLQQTGRDSVSVEELAERMNRRQANASDNMLKDRKYKPGKADKDGRKGKPGQARSGQGKGPQNELARRAMEGFDRLDANSDGKVTRREARRAPQFLQRFDRNNDGVVERSELRRPGTDNESGSRQKDKGRGAGNRQNGRAMLKRLDADGNGSLSRDEVPERMKQRFDRVDSNGDGQLSPQELSEAARRRSQKSGKPKN